MAVAANRMTASESHAGTGAPDSRRRWLTVGAVVVAYLATFALLPRGGFWICDNGAKFIQLQALLRSGYLDYSIPWSGTAVDPDFAFSPLGDPFGVVVDGRLYSQYSPFFALISSVPFRVCGLAGLYILPLLGGLLTLLAVWFIAGRLGAPPGTRPLALLLVGLCTPLWFYSMTFWEHAPATALVTWGVYLCVRSLPGDRAWALPCAAVCCGLSVYFRDELYLLVPVVVGVLLLYGRRRGHAATVFAIVAVVSFVPLWLFQWRAVGHPLGLHFAPHNALAGGLGAYVADRWQVVRALLLSAHGSEWLSVAVVVPALVLWVIRPNVSAAIHRWLVVLVAATALACGLIILHGHLTADSPMRYLRLSNGLLTVSPILWLAFVRLQSATKEAHTSVPSDARSERILWLIISAFTLLYVLTAPARIWGGIHWGCRFLLAVYPVLGVLAAATLARWWHSHAATAQASRAILIAAVALSLLLQVYSLRLLHDRLAYTRLLNQVVAARPEEIVVASEWYLPMDLAPALLRKDPLPRPHAGGVQPAGCRPTSVRPAARPADCPV